MSVRHFVPTTVLDLINLECPVLIGWTFPFEIHPTGGEGMRTEHYIKEVTL